MKQIALFDYDGTLISGDSIAHLLRFSVKKKAVPFFSVLPGAIAGLLFTVHLMDERTSKERALAFLNRLSAEKQEQLLSAFVTEDLLPRSFQDGLNRIRQLKEEGTEVWLVSASTSNYMEKVSRQLGIDHLICTEADSLGHIKVNCKGEEKVLRIKAALSGHPDAVIREAYADSPSDLPMLQLAEKPIAVNPKRALRKAAPRIDAVLWH